MITLKEAIKILGLKDSDAVYICSRHSETNALFISVGQIRNKFDMRNTMVKRIYPYHFIYTDSLDWELIIDRKEI